eukprot:TRINITY_DN12276_c0_g1_i1.p1 TRINITY_DN12276_c0_g1~~TRINITY_DN12276_c0_g1_i1.p1  ORF type:complete len:145 (+),score=19.50 TRINITY_DN12276_c0_g1_i1:3-437(+)
MTEMFSSNMFTLFAAVLVLSVVSAQDNTTGTTPPPPPVPEISKGCRNGKKCLYDAKGGKCRIVASNMKTSSLQDICDCAVAAMKCGQKHKCTEEGSKACIFLRDQAINMPNGLCTVNCNTATSVTQFSIITLLVVCWTCVTLHW